MEVSKISSKQAILGYISVFGYCLVTAISIIFIHGYTKSANPTIVALYTFIICMLFFNLMSIKNFPSTWAAVKADFKDFMILNVTTAILWLGTFWSVKLIVPSIFITIAIGTTPIAMYVYSIFKEKTILWPGFFYSFFLIAILVSAILFHLHDAPSANLKMGILLAILVGIVISINMKYSSEMQKKNKLTSLQILALRFPLIIIISIAIGLMQNPIVFVQGIHIIPITIIAVLSNIIPLYCLQSSIYKLGFLRTAYIIPLTPALTFLLEPLIGYPFSWKALILIVLLTVTVSLSNKFIK